MQFNKTLIHFICSTQRDQSEEVETTSLRHRRSSSSKNASLVVFSVTTSCYSFFFRKNVCFKLYLLLLFFDKIELTRNRLKNA